ncbi:MAG TPA: DUF5666 domain-containing protein [Gaiellaceae bacterium]|nr:DUF5666 domain-containing protein [Gaiellaceae bacterium]
MDSNEIRRRLGAGSKTASLVAAGAIAGGGAVFALGHGSGSTPAAAAARADGGGFPGQGGGLPGRGVAGERRLQGTVTATTGSSITVETSSGAATYTVDAATEIVRNGERATLADVRVGDPVLVHVYPGSNGRLLVERILAGTMPSGPGGGFGPPGGATT